MAYLQLRGIEKFFGEHRAIKGIDLTINQGEFIVFVGPSGCGKSTLLRLIAGLEGIDGGTLMLDGWSVMSRPSSINVPPSMLSSPAISRSSVDLPQPEGPTKTMNSPWLMVRSMPLMARCSPKYFSMPRS